MRCYVFLSDESAHVTSLQYIEWQYINRFTLQQSAWFLDGRTSKWPVEIHQTLFFAVTKQKQKNSGLGRDYSESRLQNGIYTTKHVLY